MIDEQFKAKNQTSYNEMIEHLITMLNKERSKAIPNQLHNKPIFLFEFFVFDLYMPRRVLEKIRQPYLFFRLLDFPSLQLQGTKNVVDEKIEFNQGKSSYFEMEVHELKDDLQKQPMYIMFADLNFGDVRMIGSSRLNISMFAYDSFLQYQGSAPKPRRNILKLFDNTQRQVAEFDMSLLIRREYYKYEENTFPLNQEKILLDRNGRRIVNKNPLIKDEVDVNKEYYYNNNEDAQKNTTSAKPYSSELLVQHNDKILNGPHVRYTMEEKTKKQFIEDMNNISDKGEGNRNSYLPYKQNIQQQERKNDNNVMAYQKQNQATLWSYSENYTNTKNANQPKQKMKAYSTYQPSLMELLKSQDRNPPGLYYHHEKPKEEVRVIRVIQERNDNKRNNEDDNEEGFERGIHYNNNTNNINNSNNNFVGESQNINKSQNVNINRVSNQSEIMENIVKQQSGIRGSIEEVYEFSNEPNRVSTSKQNHIEDTTSIKESIQVDKF
jgi:hypothetical protein